MCRKPVHSRTGLRTSPGRGGSRSERALQALRRRPVRYCCSRNRSYIGGMGDRLVSQVGHLSGRRRRISGCSRSRGHVGFLGFVTPRGPPAAELSRSAAGFSFVPQRKVIVMLEEELQNFDALGWIDSYFAQSARLDYAQLTQLPQFR